jgi:hypothetical protein
MTWVPAELHAHTLHSDGRLTVEGMALEARALGLRAVALTDHNTNTGLAEAPAAEQTAGLRIIPGMELTTFHGHLLSLGTTDYVEWRGLTRGNVGTAIDAIHAAGGLAGVAHPFHAGSPFCTGCRWDFEGTDWSAVDYLEVWSEPDPWKRPKNRLAFALWDRLLDEGRRIPGVSSQDFHGPSPERLPAVTCLGVDADGEAAHPGARALVGALAAGRVFVTLGPTLAVSAHAAGRDHGPGEAVARGAAAGRLRLTVSWGVDGRRRLWEGRVRADAMRVRGLGGTLAEASIQGDEGSVSVWLERPRGPWLRAELHGTADGDRTLVAFTSPVYLET